MIPSRTASAILSAVALVAAAGCCHPAASVQSELERTLALYGYTAYTPFRSADLPGSIFVIARNHEGTATELTVSGYSSTFRVAPAQFLTEDPQIVETFDQLRTTYSGEASLGVEILEAFVGGEIAGMFSRDISIELGDPKVVHRLELAKLAEIQGQLQPGVRTVLKDYRARDQLASVYLVLETLQVGSLAIRAKVLDQFKAKVTADKIEDAVNAKVEVAAGSTGEFTLTSPRPILIGYKAITFPDSILRDAVGVGPLAGYETLSVDDLMKAKRP